MVPCLDCRGRLDKFGDGIWRCPSCGILYSSELLATVDATVWERVTAGRLFCYQCEPVLPDLPRVFCDDQGVPIACPEHGPARARE